LKLREEGKKADAGERRTRPWHQIGRGEEKLAGERGRINGGGGSVKLGHGARWSLQEGKGTARADPGGSGYMRGLRGHRTHLKWHRMRPVTTGLMRKEV